MVLPFTVMLPLSVLVTVDVATDPAILVLIVVVPLMSDFTVTVPKLAPLPLICKLLFTTVDVSFWFTVTVAGFVPETEKVRVPELSMLTPPFRVASFEAPPLA